MKGNFQPLLEASLGGRNRRKIFRERSEKKALGIQSSQGTVFPSVHHPKDGMNTYKWSHPKCPIPVSNHTFISSVASIGQIKEGLDSSLESVPRKGNCWIMAQNEDHRMMGTMLECIDPTCTLFNIHLAQNRVPFFFCNFLLGFPAFYILKNTIQLCKWRTFYFSRSLSTFNTDEMMAENTGQCKVQWIF